jgi:signal transduction histidine kinase/ligand-binding sensor domain-containing protein
MALLMAQGAGAERHFTELGAGRGLDARIITSLLVDRQGLLWVGSREGLYRYDGYQAEAFLPDPERPGRVGDLDIRSLYEARDGALWIGTNTNGVNRRDPRTGEFQQCRHDPADPRSLSHASVFAVAEDAEGNVWVATRRGLNRLDPDGRGFTRFLHEAGNPRSLSSNWTSALHLGSSGRFWIGTHGGGVSRWIADEGRFETFSLASLASRSAGLDRVFALHEAPDRRLWVATIEGLVVLDPDRRTAAVVQLADDAGVRVIVSAMHADRRDRLWVATFEHGLFVVDLTRGVATRVSQSVVGSAADKPQAAAISVTSTDRLLLVGTWGRGVYRAPLEETGFRFMSQGDGSGGLRYPNVTAVLPQPAAGRPWIGTFGSGPYRVDVEADEVIQAGVTKDDSNLGVNVTSLAMTSDGSMFAGASTGVYRFGADGRVFGLEAHAPDRQDWIGHGPVTALVPAGAADLWVGVLDGGLFLREAKSGRYRAHRHDPAVPDSLSSNYVMNVVGDEQGSLWVGTRDAGLNRCRIEPWSCERFDGQSTGPDSLRGRNVTALRRDRDGGLWVTTNPGGLHRVHRDPGGRVVRFERWGSEHGLLSDSAMSVEADDDGTVWVSSPQGLSHLDPASGRIQNHVTRLGLPAGNFNSGASATDSRFLYFGAVQGLVSIPKATPLRQLTPAPVQVTGVEKLVAGEWQTLPPGELGEVVGTAMDDVLAFEFSVLDFAETSHEYAYRLGHEDEWTPLGRRRNVTFIDLDPGLYQLQVRGRDELGQWNTSQTIAFRVIPPFWMSTGFRGALLASIALLALALHLARLRSLRQRNAALQQLNRERKDALERASRSQVELEEASEGLRQLTGRLASAEEKERTRLSRELHDEFGQTLTAAKINLQMLRSTATDPAVAQRLDEAVLMMDRMIGQGRDIARGLRPPLLDDAGLLPALENHLKGLGPIADVRIELDAAPPIPELSPEVRTVAFRAIQEAVSNALRHARATTIRVELRGEPDALFVVIADDGVGFDTEAVARRIRRGEHLGLLGMAERARSVGGTIEFDSRPDAGSRVRIRIPGLNSASGAGGAPR